MLSLDTLEKRKLTIPLEPHWSGDRHPVFSPDSQTLAFLRDTSIASDDIYTVPLSGGEPRRVTFDNNNVPGLAWTPDGAHIVFTSRRGGTADLRLWLVSVSGGTPEPVTAGGEKGSDVAMSRQGNRLAYTVASTTGDTDIWRLELSSSTGRASSQGKFIASTREDSSPQYSPDGKRIAFSSDRSGSDEIWICDSDGSNLIQLTQFGGPGVGSPHWSPDGRQIAFDSSPEGPSQIYLINAESGRPRRITNGEADDTAPSWSVDGKWIYFSSNRSGEQQIMKVPVQGGDAVAVTGRAGYWAFESPDAKFLYYDIENHGVWSIVRVPIDGGREEPVVTKGYEMLNWAVMKDGIYFISLDGQTRRIEFYSFATGRTKQIATIGNMGFPGFSVSPDERSILYTEVEGSYSTDIMLVENFR